MSRSILVFALLLLSACSPEQSRWDETSVQDSEAAYLAFLSEFPEGNYADSARLRIETIHLTEAVAERTLDAYEAFLTQHPQGLFSDSVRYLREAAHFASAEASGEIAALTDFLERFPDGHFAESAQGILQDIFPAFELEEALEIPGISGIVGSGECAYSRGSEVNTVRIAIATVVPTVGGQTCICCGEFLKIEAGLTIGMDALFRAQGARGMSSTYNLSLTGPVPEDGMKIVAGSEGATLRKVGPGFVLVEGEANLLKPSEEG